MAERKACANRQIDTRRVPIGGACGNQSGVCEFRIYSMDDPSIYGRRAHKLSFAAAAQKGIICPYKVIISTIDKGTVDDFTRKNGITLVERDKIGAQWVANLIALRRAIEHVEAKKVISFHSRVRLAQE